MGSCFCRHISTSTRCSALSSACSLFSTIATSLILVCTRIALHPTPAVPPSSSSDNINESSRRNWTLAAVAYGVCWFIWIVGIVFLYEVIYSWWRLWRSSESHYRRFMLFAAFASDSISVDRVCLITRPCGMAPLYYRPWLPAFNPNSF